jgi:nitric oxide synthase oxygenase domain/subunit
MKTRTEKIEEFLKNLNTEVNILDFVDTETVNSFDDIRDQIEDNDGFNIEIIYYANAIEYLSNNDPSFKESLSIAEEMGFTPGNLNSEILASLLASQNARNEFYALEGEITDFFDELKAEDEN